MVAYGIWLLTSGSNYMVSNGKLLVFGCLQDMVAHGVSNF